MCVCVCVYIYIYRERERERFILITGIDSRCCRGIGAHRLPLVSWRVRKAGGVIQPEGPGTRSAGV